MPAVTTKLEMTKQDIRKGRKTGSPVSNISLSQMPRSWLGKQCLDTRMKRRVHNFLRLPDLRRHDLGFPRLVQCDQSFGMFEARGGDEECSVESGWISSGLGSACSLEHVHGHRAR